MRSAIRFSQLNSCLPASFSINLSLSSALAESLLDSDSTEQKAAVLPTHRFSRCNVSKLSICRYCGGSVLLAEKKESLQSLRWNHRYVKFDAGLLSSGRINRMCCDAGTFRRDNQSLPDHTTKEIWVWQLKPLRRCPFIDDAYKVVSWHETRKSRPKHEESKRKRA